MATVRLETRNIVDWDTFHTACKEVFGFPDFYGANMDAWIDCLSYLDEDASMTRFHLMNGEELNIEIASSANFKERQPEIFAKLQECTACVNERYEEVGSPTRIKLTWI